MKSIYLLGECMIELMNSSSDTMKQSFAGDVYNSAVYMKRCFPKTHVGLLSAVGADTLSDKMRQRFASEDINTDLVFTHQQKVPGIYLIETDETGERSFTYWRSDSAAKKVMQFVDAEVTEQLSGCDMLFFSGISLAVIDEESRPAFWQKVTQLKQAGVKIVFDPNYRARLWKNEQQAQQQFNKAFELSDIALPGVDDFVSLYQIDSSDGVQAFCESFDIAEVIIKNGPASVISVCDGQSQQHVITPVENVVDTTSAGDAFNGVYLGARLNGDSINQAISKASKAAGIVIQHPGAIAPKHAINATLI
ncbi:sugar kinase [Thalassotalea sp. Y01]|uniref:sugar kinase n=1 Tax=Thalassotalea sp. Y01 TaxID=2729613 RepID=UPI00145F8AD1|nr:sugar kinase [Thalassotalea sp. Y01]NMP15109.1 sugar kinase [Thalassotalea sp. Y01]